MPKMSNGKLERIAVGAVIGETNKPSSLLVANIPVGDKGISFDGDIEVFKDHSETVESSLGSVPVQVKGTQVDNFSTGNRTFSLGISHFRNYYDRNGVVLFVVEILENGDSKIFYKQLLPAELRQIIKYYGEVKQQKKRAVQLRPLSETTLDNVCRGFIRESKKQPPMLIEKNPFKNSDFTSFELTSLTYNPSKMEINNIFEHDFILYGIKKELNVPLEYTRIHSLVTKENEIVVLDGVPYEYDIQLIKEEKQITILIEDSLAIEYSENDSKFSFIIRKFDSLAIQLKIFTLLMNLISGKEIHFEKHSFSLGKVSIKEKRLLDKLKKQYSTLLKLKEIFKELNIDESIKITDDHDNLNKIIRDIESFVYMISENDFSQLKIAEPELAKFVYFSIGEIQIVFFYEPDSEIKLVNAFSKKLIQNDTRIIEDGQSIPYSPYIRLNAFALAFCANIDFEIIKESFDQFDPFVNDIAFHFTNDFCLECINAYDLSNNHKPLELAEYIYNKFVPNEKTVSSSMIILINLLQIKLRKEGRLSDEENQRLIDFKIASKDNIEAQFCANVLLESKIEAKLYFQKLDEQKQEFYKTLPIYQLYKKLIEN